MFITSRLHVAIIYPHYLINGGGGEGVGGSRINLAEVKQVTKEWREPGTAGGKMSFHTEDVLITCSSTPFDLSQFSNGLSEGSFISG